MLQHGAFNLLIDSCYDREKFPTLEEAFDWCWASTPEEEQAVQFVLKKFFVLEGDIYVQKRIQEELNQYRERADKNAEIAQYREYCKRQKIAKLSPLDFEEWRKTERFVNETCESDNETCTTRERNDEESQPNQEPLTINQEPLTINQDKPIDIALNGFDEFYSEYPRKKDRGKAENAWKKNKCASKKEMIMDDVRERKKRDRDWKEGFAPYPATYLNGSRWEDEIEESKNEAHQQSGKHQTKSEQFWNHTKERVRSTA